MHSLAKIIGTVVTVSGAMVMTLYKGPIVDILWYSKGGSHHHHGPTADSADHEHWVRGTIMLISCLLGWSAFFIVQVSTLSFIFFLYSLSGRDFVKILIQFLIVGKIGGSHLCLTQHESNYQKCHFLLNDKLNDIETHWSFYLFQ